MTEEAWTGLDLAREKLGRDVHCFVGVLGRDDEPLPRFAKAKMRHGAEVEIRFVETMHKGGWCCKNIQLYQLG